jgi:pantothenate kinase type III
LYLNYHKNKIYKNPNQLRRRHFGGFDQNRLRKRKSPSRLGNLPQSSTMAAVASGLNGGLVGLLAHYGGKL